MNNDEEFLRVWLERVNSLANSEAHSNVPKTSSEGDEESVRRKRPAESRREGKKNRVKRQCVSKSSDKSPDNLLKKKIRKRERMRSTLEALKELTPNCPQSDISAILDCVIEYTKHLQLAILFTILHDYARNM